MRLVLTIIIVILSQILFSCGTPVSEFPQEIDYVLSQAKGNRAELEKVLRHYAAPDDSLKRRAAEYLILNMEGKHTEKYDCALDAFVASRYRWFDTPDKTKLEEVYHVGEKTIVPDLEAVTADYLIENIEMAFKVWREVPWSKSVDFDTFCEEILPYRIDSEPLAPWRRQVMANFSDMYEYFTATDSLTIEEACEMVNRQLPEYEWVTYDKPSMTYTQLLTSTKGNCDDMCNIAIFTMRALGIPVTKDFTLQWPNRASGHAWNVVFNGEKHISFMGTEYHPGEMHSGLRLKKSKVYRHTFRNQKLAHEDIPPLLANSCMVDVSGEYPGCNYNVKVSININKDESAGRNVYLKAFNKSHSAIIDCGEVADGAVQFKNIGYGVTYIPVTYDKGIESAVGMPFCVTDDGALKIYDGFGKEKVRVAIDDVGLSQSMLGRMQGGVFEGASDSLFHDREILYTIRTIPVAGYNEAKIFSRNKYRYLRYVSPKGCNGNAAEIEFLDYNGMRLKGTPIGTQGSWYDSGMTADKLFDGDIYTYFDAPKGRGDYAWSGLDLGSPGNVAAIRYYPRIEDCRIKPGQVYEIYVWQGDEWGLYHRERAVTAHLDLDLYDNALYYIRDVRQDMESEKIFTVIDGKQKWLL